MCNIVENKKYWKTKTQNLRNAKTIYLARIKCEIFCNGHKFVLSLKWKRKNVIWIWSLFSLRNIRFHSVIWKNKIIFTHYPIHSRTLNHTAIKSFNAISVWNLSYHLFEKHIDIDKKFQMWFRTNEFVTKKRKINENFIQ